MTMRRGNWFTALSLLCATGSAVLAAPGPATLRLSFNQTCYKPGDTLTASVIMENLGSPAAGFQAFLHYDITKLQFVSGSYTPTPFGLALISPIAASGGDIDLASGIDQFSSQPPTMTSATLATLTFTALRDSGCLGNPGSFLTFRSHNPSTRVTNTAGDELLPLTLTDSPPFVPGHGTLRLVYSQACYEPGHQVVISLRMEDICSPVSGFQAFLHFDTTKLAFVSGSYTPAPFGLPVISPITASGGDIDLASGIDQFNGQAPTTGDATLATLTFNVTAAAACGGNPLSGIFFRPHNPPTRLTNQCGVALSPMTLIDAPPVLPGPAMLRLTYDQTCYRTGQTVTASVRMEGLCDPAAGFQAFLAYDASRLSFTGWSYTASPFGLPVINTNSGCGVPDVCVNPSPGVLNLASGIDQFHGQTPTTSDATLVTLTFTVIATNDCNIASTLTFRSHNPSTRVTNACGTELTPLTLIAAPAVRFDGLAPTLVCPPPVTVQCPGNIPAHANDRASFLALPGTSVSDNCDPAPTVAFVSDVTSNVMCANHYTVTRTYQATDSCGNVGTCTQIITVNDTLPPVFDDCPPNATVECDDVPPPAPVTAHDNCDPSPSVTFNEVSTQDADATHCEHYNYTLTRTWTASDGCNSATCTQTLTVHDTTKPVFDNCPINVTAECDNVPLAPVVTAHDNCDPNPTIVPTEVSTQDPDTTHCTHYNYTITRTWLAVDKCGNAQTCMQVVTVHDTTKPVFDNCPTDVAVECDAVPLAMLVTAHDNCDPHPSVVLSQISTQDTDPTHCAHYNYTLTRTWTATDACGNLETCTQVITVHDTTNPGFTFCPLNVAVNAAAGGCTAGVVTGTPVASDNCDPAPSITFTREDSQTTLSAPFSSSFNGVGGAGVTQITWTATDACGNHASCIQNVTVHPVNELIVSVQLKGNGFPASLNRCITFELFGCPNTNPTVVNQVLTFSSGRSSNALVLVPCGAYTCITARDKLHTLRRTDNDNFGVQPIFGTQYIADFTDRTGVGGDDDSLIGGNLNDSEFIDIADFGIYVGQYNANYGTGNTMCSTPSPHADSSGNGTVFTEDFTFIQINYLKQREANCCSLPNFLASPEQAGEKPITSITVAKLREQGVPNPSAADLNGDGVVDQADLSAWLAGARPGQPLPAPRRR